MSGLDVAQQAALDSLLSALSRKGIAVVMSSHDLNHTLRHAHRVWLLSRGRMIASGARDQFLRRHIWHVPITCRSAGWISRDIRC